MFDLLAIKTNDYVIICILYFSITAISGRDFDIIQHFDNDSVSRGESDTMKNDGKKLLWDSMDEINSDPENDSIRENATTAENDIDSRTSVLWINSTYQAYDIGLNITLLDECTLLMRNELIINTSSNTTQEQMNDTNSAKWRVPNLEIVSSKERLEELGVDANLLDRYKNIGIFFDEICKNYPRELWFSTVEDARQLGITKSEPLVCSPFKEELHPSQKKLKHFALILNEIVHNSTLNETLMMMSDPTRFDKYMTSLNEAIEIESEHDSEHKLYRRRVVEFLKKIPNDDDIEDKNSIDVDNGDNSADNNVDDSDKNDKNSWVSLQDSEAYDEGMIASIVIQINANEQKFILL